MKKKLIKYKCEVCGWNDNPDLLEGHHIVEQTDLKTSNHNLNICLLCSNCHSKIHAGVLKIFGIYPSTEPPNGRTAVYEIDGVCNIPELKSPYFTHKPKQMKVKNG